MGLLECEEEDAVIAIEKEVKKGRREFISNVGRGGRRLFEVVKWRKLMSLQIHAPPLLS